MSNTDHHYSQLLGERYHRTPVDTYPVDVVNIDGKDTIMRIRPKLVEPGPRVIRVQGPPGGAGTAKSRTDCARRGAVNPSTTPSV